MSIRANTFDSRSPFFEARATEREQRTTQPQKKKIPRALARRDSNTTPLATLPVLNCGLAVAKKRAYVPAGKVSIEALGSAMFKELTWQILASPSTVRNLLRRRPALGLRPGRVPPHGPLELKAAARAVC